MTLSVSEASGSGHIATIPAIHEAPASRQPAVPMPPTGKAPPPICPDSEDENDTAPSVNLVMAKQPPPQLPA